jgi:hypothetical protein
MNIRNELIMHKIGSLHIYEMNHNMSPVHGSTFAG